MRLGMALLATISGMLFLLGCKLGRTLPERPARLLGVATVVALGAYIVFLSNDIRMARLLPVSSLVARST